MLCHSPKKEGAVGGWYFSLGAFCALQMNLQFCTALQWLWNHSDKAKGGGEYRNDYSENNLIMIAVCNQQSKSNSFQVMVQLLAFIVTFIHQSIKLTNEPEMVSPAGHRLWGMGNCGSVTYSMVKLCFMAMIPIYCSTRDTAINSKKDIQREIRSFLTTSACTLSLQLQKCDRNHSKECDIGHVWCSVL